MDQSCILPHRISKVKARARQASVGGNVAGGLGIKGGVLESGKGVVDDVGCRQGHRAGPVDR